MQKKSRNKALREKKMDKNFNLKYSRLPKELKFLLEISMIEKNTQFKNFILEKDFDWELFVNLAMHHRLYPLIYSKLKIVDQELFPLDILLKLQQEYRKNTFQMLYLSSEMEQLSKLFSENEIRLIVLKGPVLADDLYGDVSLRTCGDLDVLIPITEIYKADRLLLESGYLKEDNFQTELSDWKWRHHHITYYHPQKRVKLEIHWRLNPGPGKEPNFNELWERKRKSRITIHPVYYLGKEDLFFYLVTHGARHGWFRLRWLVDIAQMEKQDLNWCKIYKLLKSLDYLDVGGQAIILTSKLLKINIIEPMKPLLNRKRSYKLAEQSVFFFEKMVNLHTDTVKDDVGRYYKHYLFSLKSKRQKLLSIISFLYPSPTDLETLSLPKSFYFLYFPLRPLLWAWRRTKRGHVLS